MGVRIAGIEGIGRWWWEGRMWEVGGGRRDEGGGRRDWEVSQGFQ